ncbi:stage III sporulation protein AD [Haloimpatiens lingqiaonensis]|uniref:stage III sporulation protein AD n=1 Tax=Haloimpatiens lingqiaonensis TaxID=1380675 RepID=UPI0010FE0793|nr:stage III sporulation protein AD [Haloimpatiens lingqiaonensis]
MEIVKIATFAFIALFILSIFKKRRDDIALLISIFCGCSIFVFMIDKLSVIIKFLQNLATKANIDFVYLNIVFKVLAIAFLATFCSEICKDAGEGTIASKVEFGGKILILALSIPILMAVLDTITKIL